jgi:hypothetical protein
MVKTVRVTRSGNTISVRVGAYVEAFDTTLMTRADAYDRIKWAAITAGASLNDVSVLEILREVYSDDGR